MFYNNYNISQSFDNPLCVASSSAAQFLINTIFFYIQHIDQCPLTYSLLYINNPSFANEDFTVHKINPHTILAWFYTEPNFPVADTDDNHAHHDYNYPFSVCTSLLDWP